MSTIMKKIYIYRDSHLPERGWMQSCYNCCLITSHVITFKTIKKENGKYKNWEFYVYLCKHCQNHLYQKENLTKYIDFTKDCNHYIKQNYYYLFTS